MIRHEGDSADRLRAVFDPVRVNEQLDEAGHTALEIACGSVPHKQADFDGASGTCTLM